ncbi:MAG: 2-oxoacid:acceptor oxidoreductase subunit alpha [Spirochaetaceae bacterium]
MKSEKTIHKEVSIVLAGAAGQGIQSIEKILSRIVKDDGYHIFTTSEFMSRVRGGMNSTEIRVSSRPGHAYVDKIDIFIPLKKGLTPFLEQRITEDTIVIGEKEELDYDEIIDVPFSAIAKEIGNKLYSNSVALGLIGGLLKLSEELMEEHITAVFTSKGDDVVDKNRKALQEGYRRGRELGESCKIEITKGTPEKQMLLSGTDAVALGALAGGCNMISSYPMSPSTGVLVSLAGYAERMGIVVEQAESEIAAVNMAIGGWYAGARAMITTAGGGYDLMTEGTSLAAMIESPMVFHIAQRPGPATGLPTRTGQEDLDLVLYAAHGEFPRVILAPGTTTEAFELARSAFDIADRYQVPVFILTDQYLLDSFFDTPRLQLDTTQPANHIVETDADYTRYRLTDDGLSPRGIPGYGQGRVRVDSDEHTEEGFITEDVVGVRPPMVEKRLYKKHKLLQEASLPPLLIGPEEYSTLIISWGSNRNVAEEALEKIGSDNIALLHLRQLYPLHASVAEYIDRAARTCLLENNATGQCAELIRRETGREIDEKILKYNGIPFSVEEVQEKIENIAGVDHE